MSSLDSLFARQIAAEGVALRVIDDTPAAIRLRYKGTGTVTSVTVTTGTNIVMVTSDGGTDTYAFATYDTIAKLVAVINADNIFEAKVMDALLADVTTSKFIDGAITAGTDENGVTTWDVLADTSATDYMTVTLSPRRNWDATPGHRVHLQEIAYNVDVSAAAANGVRVYRRRKGIETQVYGRASVDATLTTLTFASGQGKISGKPGDELIVRVIDGTSITDAAANFIQIVGVIE